MVAVPVNPGQFCKQPCLSKGWDAGAESAGDNTAAGFLARAPLGRPPPPYRRKNFPAPLRDNKAGTQEGKAPKGANTQEDPRGTTRGASLIRTGQEQDPGAQGIPAALR